MPGEIFDMGLNQQNSIRENMEKQFENIGHKNVKLVDEIHTKVSGMILPRALWTILCI